MLLMYKKMQGKRVEKYYQILMMSKQRYVNNARLKFLELTVTMMVITFLYCPPIQKHCQLENVILLNLSYMQVIVWGLGCGETIFVEISLVSLCNLLEHFNQSNIMSICDMNQKIIFYLIE